MVGSVRRADIVPDEGAVTGPGEEPRIDQRAENRVARFRVEAPQPLRLRRGQPQAGHFEKLSADASHDVLEHSTLVWHPSSART